MNPANNSHLNGAGGDQNHQMVGKSYSLSAAAKEFVPRSYMSQQPENGLAARAGGGDVSMLFQQMPYSQNYRQPQFRTQAMLEHQQQAQLQAQQQHQYNAQQASAIQQTCNQSASYNYQQQFQQASAQGSDLRQQSHQPPALNPQDPMAQLKQAILIITKEPSTFDDTMPDLVSSLASRLQTEEKLVKMVEELFRQSLEEANFRYTGARVCNYFSHHLKVQFNSKGFKHYLLERCVAEQKKSEELVKDCDNRYKLVGFTLFMAELLLNMMEFPKTDEITDYKKILAKGVQELLQTLLSQPAEDSLRCVTQVLKLCGGILEEVEVSAHPDCSSPKMDQIFSIIKQAILESSYIKSLRAQMLSVIELRASNWGNQETSHKSVQPSSVPVQTAASEAASHAPSFTPGVPMYYNTPDQGQAMGNQASQPDMSRFGSTGFFPEEMCFYGSGDEEFQNQEELYYMYNGVECPQEDDMDPEIAEAFEEFLKTQPKQG